MKFLMSVELPFIIFFISVQIIFRMKHKKAIFVPRREGISCRIEKENPLTDSPLVTLPDYTFMDGRATPLGVSLSTLPY